MKLKRIITKITAYKYGGPDRPDWLNKAIKSGKIKESWKQGRGFSMTGREQIYTLELYNHLGVYRSVGVGDWICYFTIDRKRYYDAATDFEIKNHYKQVGE